MHVFLVQYLIMNLISVFSIYLFYFLGSVSVSKVSFLDSDGNDEKYRPAFHFTPDSMWMNDPNGLVFYKGEYHLFYQFHPKSNVWGPMHWGHAVSKDLIQWQHLPIALYPDSLGYIFSGSAVIDWENTSGFGTKENPPMVAIFTYHNAEKEQLGTNDFQTQGIAYSIDHGRTWEKYAANPVIPNNNHRDFRDPKVIWHPATKKWIMVLAVKDKAMFYASSDLKSWTFESEYGLKNEKRLWECPDLFPIKVSGTNETKWVLVVSMQSGAPNGGTGTSYFVGDFDGHRFTNSQSDNKQYWLDSGTDNYAMVSWSDMPATDGRKLMLGWMSNWQYAQQVPTKRWRSAMTLPREVTLVKTADNEWKLKSKVVNEFSSTRKDKISTPQDKITGNKCMLINQSPLICESLITIDRSKCKESFQILITSTSNDSLMIGYDPSGNNYFIDRRKAGISEFNPLFAAKHKTPCLSKDQLLKLHLLVDKTSVELFTDDGLTVMTDIFFPKSEMNKIEILSNNLPELLKENTVYTLYSKR